MRAQPEPERERVHGDQDGGDLLGQERRVVARVAAERKQGRHHHRHHRQEQRRDAGGSGQAVEAELAEADSAGDDAAAADEQEVGQDRSGDAALDQIHVAVAQGGDAENELGGVANLAAPFGGRAASQLSHARRFRREGQGMAPDGGIE